MVSLSSLLRSWTEPTRVDARIEPPSYERAKVDDPSKYERHSLRETYRIQHRGALRWQETPYRITLEGHVGTVPDVDDCVVRQLVRVTAPQGSYGYSPAARQERYPIISIIGQAIVGQTDDTVTCKKIFTHKTKVATKALEAKGFTVSDNLGKSAEKQPLL